MVRIQVEFFLGLTPCSGVVTLCSAVVGHQRRHKPEELGLYFLVHFTRYNLEEPRKRSRR